MSRFADHAKARLKAVSGPQALAAGGSLVVHGLAAALLLALPAHQPPAVERSGGRAVEIRFYTIAGGPEAETDAPLNEPPLSARSEPAGAGRGGEAGSGDGARNESDATEPEPATERGAPETEPSAEETAPANPPDPVDDPPSETAPPPETETATSVAPTRREPEPPADETAPPDAPTARAGRDGVSGPAGERIYAPQPTDPAAGADAPVATTQVDPAPVEARLAAAAAAPSLADILARAGDPLAAERVTLDEIEGAVLAVVRESFCLSSSAANLEAGECGDAPNPDSARLAQFGLSEPGEEPPVFLEDMDRLAFQLRQLGASPARVERILIALGEARRRARETPDLVRAMRRDAAGETDHLGVADPFGGRGDPTPDNPGG